jgi:transposase
MSENTARRYRDLRQLPSESRPERTWRTREDPFDPADWAWVVEKLRSPEGAKLQAKVLFRAMRKREDVAGTYTDGQLRSFQRRVRRWRAQHGPEKEVFFAQEHRPGEAMQTDWTDGTRLGVTLANEAFPHKLCHTTLPYSNWRSVRVCRSESMASLKDGVQAALRKLGRHTVWHQTDQSSAATHDKLGGREFNRGYADFVAHHGMKPRTIAVRKPNQNGDVEAGNGALVSAIDQALRLRGHRDFVDQEAYGTFVDGVVDEMNEDKSAKLQVELDAMTPVTAAWAPTFKRVDVRVGSQSTMRVDQNTYSVPSRLIGEQVEVRVFDAVLEVWFAGRREFSVERLTGRCRARIDYRHVISSLRRKPGAFQRYRYRDEMFPRPVFRRCYDALTETGATGRKDAAYLDVLHLAASTSEEDVVTALELLLEDDQVPTRDAVVEVIGSRRDAPPDLTPYAPNLKCYDDLLQGVAG